MSNLLTENKIRQIVVETLREILNDPDFGLEIREEIIKRLKKKPKNLISLEKIKKSLNEKI
jgi:signal recognition particle GTPase